MLTTTSHKKNDKTTVHRDNGDGNLIKQSWQVAQR